MLAPLLAFVLLVFELGLRVTKKSDPAASTGADRGSLAVLWITTVSAVVIAAILPRFVPQANYRLGGLGTKLAVLLFVLGFALRVWAIVLLGRFFTVDVAIQKDHALMTHGPFAWVRHPSYTGLVMMWTAIGLLFENGLSIVVLLGTVLLSLSRRMAIEERVLAAAFGETWMAYAARTRRLIPFIY
jgi:protein-S-isoprenylcysteine O-methyltransferase